MTFTFVEYENCDTGATRFVALRSDLEGEVRSTRHLTRFMQGRGNFIIAMHQVDKPTLPEAWDWLDLCLNG